MSDHEIAKEFVKDLENITKSGSLRKNYQSDGGFDKALSDFYSLPVKNVREVSTPKFGDALVGYLPDGTSVIARRSSKSGMGATLEFQLNIDGRKQYYEVRYGE